MERYKAKSNRNQMSLFPLCFDDTIDEDNSVTAIDAIAESMEIPTLGFRYSDMFICPMDLYSASCFLKISTSTSMLDRMETTGLIKRIYNKSDRRQIIIVLTKKASSLRAEYDRVSAKMNEIFYQGFKDEEIKLFEDQLIRILYNLNRGEEKNESFCTCFKRFLPADTFSVWHIQRGVRRKSRYGFFPCGNSVSAGFRSHK